VFGIPPSLSAFAQSAKAEGGPAHWVKAIRLVAAFFAKTRKKADLSAITRNYPLRLLTVSMLSAPFTHRPPEL
jgi:hypothetical protein